MRPVECIEIVRDEGEGGVNGQLHDRDSCRLDQSDINDTLMLLQNLLHSFKSHSHLIPLMRRLHPSQDRLVNSNVNITILDRDSIGTASE